MSSNPNLNAIFERIANGQETEGDMQTLRQLFNARQGQNSIQIGKYHVNINEGRDIQIGDRIYQGTDAEAIKEALRLVLLEKQNLTPQEYKNRQALLSKVKNFWVKGVLQKSLHNQVLISLGLEEHPDAVVSPWNMTLGVNEQTSKVLPQNTSLISIFDELGTGRTLLILGEPGAGKTTTLLQLTRDLINRAEQNTELLIPVVFNLSSWQGKNQKIADWLVEELNSKYQVPKKIGNQWVEKQELLLLLDGLDEIREENKNACVTALNAFGQDYHTEMVVCSRIKEYKNFSQRLNFQKAIFLNNVSPEQIQRYFKSLDADLTGLKSLLAKDIVLQGLAKSPLMLNMMVLVYQGVAIEDLPRTNILEQRQAQLFNAYIEKMFNRGNRSITNLRYSKKQTILWLMWLAQRMVEESQTVFLIERMQPTWLKPKQKRYYRLITDPLSLLFRSDPSDKGIEIVEVLTWSWSAASVMIVELITVPLFAALCMLLMGIIIGLLGELLDWRGRFLDGLFLGFMCGLIIGLIMVLLLGLFGGLRSSELDTQAYPNQGIWKSAINCVIAGLVFGMLGGLMFGLMFGLFNAIGTKQTGVMSGLIGCVLLFGILGALYYGGTACLQHLALRLILYHQASIPWNYAHFLDYAAERIFLQKVGGGYVFIHRLLMEHFAAMPLEK